MVAIEEIEDEVPSGPHDARLSELLEQHNGDPSSLLATVFTFLKTKAPAVSADEVLKILKGAHALRLVHPYPPPPSGLCACMGGQRSDLTNIPISLCRWRPRKGSLLREGCREGRHENWILP
jgi:hypothetical protein